MEDIEFAISAEHDEESADPALTSLTAGTLATGAVDTGIIEKDIENKTGTVLPETGAAGTMGLILGGSALVILAVVFMITRKKMSVYED
jgi:LPXTG-motif cell wall-anchored protein